LESLLLKTKLHVPKPIPGVVRRSRLLAKLNERLGLGRPFTLISAPAGYGKTTLVADWLDGVNQVQVWLSLDEHDNDPVRFIKYFIAALQVVDKNIGLETTRLLSGSGMLPLQAVEVTLINEIVATSEPFILVLDDFHVIRHESVFHLVQALLDNHPFYMHLVMITREDPALSLPRLRVRNQMTELRMEDLRFDLDETGDFLATSVSVKLKHEEVSALEVRTEGWIGLFRVHRRKSGHGYYRWDMAEQGIMAMILSKTLEVRGEYAVLTESCRSFRNLSLAMEFP